MEKNHLLTKIEEFKKLGLIKTEEVITLRANLSTNKLSVILFINVIYRLLIMITKLQSDIKMLRTTAETKPETQEPDRPEKIKTKK